MEVPFAISAVFFLVFGFMSATTFPVDAVVALFLVSAVCALIGIVIAIWRAHNDTRRF